MSKPRKLKKAVIKENLKILTGSWLKALILNQFIYWSERSDDVDDFLVEEQKRALHDGKDFPVVPLHGWIYKKTEELIDELMVDSSRKLVRNLIQEMVEKGWLDQRNNPTYKWDRTLQYRPNIVKIQSDLSALGHVLDGYPIQCVLSHIRMCQTEHSKGTFDPYKGGVRPIQRGDSTQAIPETTTKITTETTTETTNREGDVVASPPSLEVFEPEEKEKVLGKPRHKTVVHMAETWNATVAISGAVKVRLDMMIPKTEKMALAAYTKLEEDGWQELLGIVAGSSFLNGNNERGFRISFAWMLKPTNLEKIMEGFYPSKVIQQSEKDVLEKKRLIAEQNKKIDEEYKEWGM